MFTFILFTRSVTEPAPQYSMTSHSWSSLPGERVVQIFGSETGLQISLKCFVPGGDFLIKAP